MDRLKDRARRWGQHLESYRRILAYVRDYRWHLALAGLSLVVIGLLGLAMPWIVQQVVDLLVGGQELDRLNLYALALGAILLLRSALGIVQTYVVAWVGERVVARLRRELYEHLLSLSLGFFAGRPVGELQSRLTNDVQVIQVAVTSNIIVLVQQVVMAAGIVAIVAITNWRLTLLLAVSVPGMVFLTRIMGRRIRRVARETQDVLAQASAVVEETVGGIRVVKSFAREDHEAARFGQKVNDLFSAAMRRARIYATMGPLMSLLVYGSLGLVLWMGGREVLLGRLTPGQLIAFLFYATMLSGPLSSFGGLYGQIQAAVGATERAFELLDTRPEIGDAPDAEPLPPVRGHVVFRAVEFDYDPRQPVLRHVSLEALPGEVVALVGPSGVGKTTLANLIPRFYDPARGSITVDGRDIRGVTVRSLRDQIGIVPQETLLFSDTVAANIRYGRLDATRDEIEAAARAANAHDFICNDLPDGYETQVGERGVKLSGGQRQRVAIARAILKDPRILILDEATSSLDTESETLVQEAVDRLMHPPDGEGRTTFVIAHRLSTIVNADRIVVLHEGRVAEQGSHAELLASKDSLYRRYHALQFRWDADEEAPPPTREERGAFAGQRDWPSLLSLPFLPPPGLGQDPDPEGGEPEA